jgi:hypothetical protein
MHGIYTLSLKKYYPSMVMEHDISLAVTLRPVWHQDPPLIEISCGRNVQTVSLDQTQTFKFDYRGAGPQTLSIKFLNKKDSDTIVERGLDKCVIIEQISFFGISDPKFIWIGQYNPVYSEPWASQQRESGHTLDKVLTNTNTLSWNGEWKLEFHSPIFTWIHKLQNLGWIYA